MFHVSVKFALSYTISHKKTVMKKYIKGNVIEFWNKKQYKLLDYEHADFISF